MEQNKIIGIASLKGGVGKTTLALFMAQAWFDQGLRVLLVDLDSNNNATTYSLPMESEAEVNRRNVAHVFQSELELDDCIHTSRFGYDIVPATKDLHSIARDLAYDSSVNFHFVRQLEKSKYDIVLFDSPPSWGFETSLTMFASDLLISPVAYFDWVLQGFTDLEEPYLKTRQKLGKSAEAICVGTMIKKPEISKITSLGLPMAETIIPQSASIKKAELFKTKLKPDSAEYDAFRSLAGEVLFKFNPSKKRKIA
jgi:chromosome partitioning protein